MSDAKPTSATDGSSKEIPRQKPRLAFFKGMLTGAAIEVPLIAATVWWLAQVGVGDPDVDFMRVMRLTTVFCGVAALFTAGGIGRLAAYASVEGGRRRAIWVAARAHAVAGAGLVLIAAIPHGHFPATHTGWFGLCATGLVPGALSGMIIGFVCGSATTPQIAEVVAKPSALRQLLDPRDIVRLGSALRTRTASMFDGMFDPAEPPPEDDAPIAPTRPAARGRTEASGTMVDKTSATTKKTEAAVDKTSATTKKTEAAVDATTETTKKTEAKPPADKPADQFEASRPAEAPTPARVTDRTDVAEAKPATDQPEASTQPETTAEATQPATNHAETIAAASTTAEAPKPATDKLAPATAEASKPPDTPITEASKPHDTPEVTAAASPATDKLEPATAEASKPLDTPEAPAETDTPEATTETKPAAPDASKLVAAETAEASELADHAEAPAEAAAKVVDKTEVHDEATATTVGATSTTAIATASSALESKSET